MALPAQPLPLPDLEIDATLRRLPAQARAGVAWARKPIAAGLARLRSDALTSEIVASAAEQLTAPLQAIGSAARTALAANIDAYRAAVMTDFANDEQALSAFVEDDNSRDTVERITGLLRSFYGTVLATLTPEKLAAVDEGTWQEIASRPELAPFM